MKALAHQCGKSALVWQKDYQSTEEFVYPKVLSEIFRAYPPRRDHPPAWRYGYS
jgi:hypothetical protein